MSELRTPAPQVGRFAAPPAPENSEARLFLGYREAARTDGTGIEVRPCICGGAVHADPDAPAKGVQAHNYTARHKAYRLNRGEDDPGTWDEPEA